MQKFVSKRHRETFISLLSHGPSHPLSSSNRFGAFSELPQRAAAPHEEMPSLYGRSFQCFFTINRNYQRIHQSTPRESFSTHWLRGAKHDAPPIRLQSATKASTQRVPNKHAEHSSIMPECFKAAKTSMVTSFEKLIFSTCKNVTYCKICNTARPSRAFPNRNKQIRGSLIELPCAFQSVQKSAARTLDCILILWNALLQIFSSKNGCLIVRGKNVLAITIVTIYTLEP